MSGPQSGRRPELRDGTGDGREEGRAHGGVLPGGDGEGHREGDGEAMKGETAAEPVSVEEGRCQRCGEEIQPVPT